MPLHPYQEQENKRPSRYEFELFDNLAYLDWIDSPKAQRYLYLVAFNYDNPKALENINKEMNFV